MAAPSGGQQPSREREGAWGRAMSFRPPVLAVEVIHKRLHGDRARRKSDRATLRLRALVPVLLLSHASASALMPRTDHYATYSA